MRPILPPVILIFVASLAAAGPVRQWTPETKLWLGRSCVGEAGFHAVDECSAIAWTYATRAKETGMPFLKLVRRYSAAIKTHEKHRRGWIFELQLDGSKPKGWPKRLKWGHYRRPWLDLLGMLDHWAKGKIENTVPGANHFGGTMDTPGISWVRIHPTVGHVVYRNRFYRAVRVVQGKPASSALTCNSVMNGKR